MKLHPSISLLVVIAIAAPSVLLDGHGAPQYPYGGRTIQNPSLQRWENDRVRVRRIVLAPGEALSEERGADSVFVYMTADPDGRMPPAEAVWQTAGPRELRNRGRARFEAVLIEFKDVPPRTSGATPPEAFGSPDLVDVWSLIDNPRVVVIKQRLAPVAYYDSPHFHTEDVIVVYLGGGHTWPPVKTWGYYRVSRGDFDIVPANTLHSFSNAGSDPLVFLVIVPKSTDLGPAMLHGTTDTLLRETRRD